MIDVNLFSRVNSSNDKILHYIRQNSININYYDEDIGETLLHLAIRRNNYKLVKLLIQLDCDIDNINVLGETPILLSLKLGYNKISELLIKNNCCLLLTDNYNKSVLHNAILYSSEKILELLLNQKYININSRDNDGNSALHLTCFNKNIKKAILLVKGGIDINVLNKKHRTELSVAINKGNIELIYYLIMNNCKC